MHRNVRLILLVAVVALIAIFAYRHYAAAPSSEPAPAPVAQPVPVAQQPAPASTPAPSSIPAPATEASPSQTRSVVMQPEVPEPTSLHAHVYNEDADAKKTIAGALALAQATNKNVLLDFGANWCPDCQVLDIYMHDDANSPIIEKYYVPVHIDVGRMDKNLDVAHTFNVPINKGIPALAVVQPSGRVVYSQTHGEFNNMRAMQSSSLTEFLKMWRPLGPRK